MSSNLFQLVPAVYRLQDGQIAQSMSLMTSAEQATIALLQAKTPPLAADEQAQLDGLIAKGARGPLESLLMVIEEQLQVFAEDLDQLYDDQFIETCAPWVIPYIGDLIGYQSITGIAPTVDNPRSEVADTISFRRRKGTVLVLEQLARDITGWDAHALEFFQVLADTQYVKHVRLWNFRSPNVRGWEPRLYRYSGFSRLTRTVDVRNPATPGVPRYNVQNIGIFLWSLSAYGITQGDVAAATSTAGALCYRFSPLGMDMPLFHLAIPQGEQITAAATPVNVPDRLRRVVLCADMQKGVGSSYYGEGASLALYLGGQLLNPYQIQVANLSGADGAWNNVPAATSTYSALVDPELGRVALPPGTAPKLSVAYCYGFNAEMGGGEYERADSFQVTDAQSVYPFPDTDSSPRYLNLNDALTYVIEQMTANGEAALEVTTSHTYTLAAGVLEADLPTGSTLEFRAADGNRPTLLLDGELSVTGAALSTMILNGLVIGASAAVTPGSPSAAALIHVPKTRPDGTTNSFEELSLTHCTLVPGWSVNTSGWPVQGGTPVLIVQAAGVKVASECTILGAIRAVGLATVSLADSIVDATDPTLVAYADLDGKSGGGALTLTGCTVVGKVHAEVLTLVSNSIVWAALAVGDTWVSGLVADRKQQGCVRFSFLPVNAVTPRRFRCVEQALASPQPYFFSLRYGNPTYMKMLACTDNLIRRGADDEGEMGAFHFVLAPQRESDLSVRLQEYLPVGLNIGIIYGS
jgi:hypothetical protein